jgi:hypothetical protein
MTTAANHLADHRCRPRARERLSLGSAPDEPRSARCGVALAPWQIAYQTYGALNAARSNAVLICHALTGDQHVANEHPGDRQGRLVGDHGRAGQACRHRPLLRHLLECGRRLHGHDRPGLANPETGRPMGSTSRW